MSLLVSRDCTDYISLNADDGQIYTVAYRNKKTTKLENENNKPKTETRNKKTETRGNPKQKHTNTKEIQTRNTPTQKKTKPETQNLTRKKKY